MSCYIASSDNRFYAALESEYGMAASVTQANRLPVLSLRARQEVERPRRIDKTGSRTFSGLPAGLRRHTTFELTTLMTGWADTAAEPPYGPLFQAALGRQALVFGGGTLSSQPDPSRIVSTEAHGLIVGQGVTCAGEIRFVTSIIDDNTIVLNAPLTQTPAPGAPIGPTVTYMPATKLPSVSIFDYWAPEDSVQRVITGGGLDKLRLTVNGDLHQFTFTGVAGDIVDSASFAEGQAGLLTFPAEPAVADWNYSLVPGNLGQAWIGATPRQFFTVLEAQIVLDNDIDLRSNEFGVLSPRCMAPGVRNVTADFRVNAGTGTETMELYQASRQRSPVSMMLQLGEQYGHLCGIMLQAVVPEVPEFEDDERRLQWRFRNCAAQGVGDDELIVAFG